MQRDKGVMPSVTTSDDLLTVEDVATLLRTTIRNVRDWTRQGRLTAAGKAGREWRYRRSDVERFLRQGIEEG